MERKPEPQRYPQGPRGLREHIPFNSIKICIASPPTNRAVEDTKGFDGQNTNGLGLVLRARERKDKTSSREIHLTYGPRGAAPYKTGRRKIKAFSAEETREECGNGPKVSSAAIGIRVSNRGSEAPNEAT